EGRFASKKSPTTTPNEGRGHGETRHTKVRWPIKALAFNTLLSSQETDTHRWVPLSRFPLGGDSFTLSDPTGLSISGLF
ncbi:hypothetical protein SMC26_21315, partial [Actinomadura fulvescens]|uniref:hypothetical protein n=1 Tax=Actinomadura fulvescens TaxID=46160 RepID=UPI00397CF770